MSAKKTLTPNNNGSPVSLLAVLPLCVIATLSLIDGTAALQSPEYGETVVAGGYNYSSFMIDDLASVEMIGVRDLPDLPVAVEGNTLSGVNSVLYSCGGVIESVGSDKCYTLNLSSSDPQWEYSLTLPGSMGEYGIAITMGTHIWFFQFDKYLYDFDTTLGSYRSYMIPMELPSFIRPCGVTNGTHTFIAGAGEFSTEIWINSDASSPSSWSKVANCTQRDGGRCLWLGNEIIFTGGEGVDRPERSTEIFDVTTYETRKAANMSTERTDHGMFVLDGKAAVVGGPRAYSLIETYDSASDTWSNSSVSLNHPRNSFGLAQFVNY